MVNKVLTEEETLEKRSEERELGARQVQNVRGKMFNNISLLDATISTQTSCKSKFKLNTKTCFSLCFATSGNQHRAGCSSQKLKSPSLFSLPLISNLSEVLLLLLLKYSSNLSSFLIFTTSALYHNPLLPS